VKFVKNIAESLVGGKAVSVCDCMYVRVRARREKCVCEIACMLE